MGVKESLLPAAEIIVPSLRGRPDQAQAVYENFMVFFQDLDENSRGKLGLFFKVLNVISFCRYLKPYRSLDYDTRYKFFCLVERFPVGLIMAGFFGLRSLILMSYYSTEDAWKKIGYRGPIVKRSLRREP